MESIWFSAPVYFFPVFCKWNVHINCPSTDQSRVWQASLKAEDILNSWPDDELGRVLRDYGEESNWFALQKKIVRARLTGGLHTTSQLVGLIRSSTSWTKGASFLSFSFKRIIFLCHLCKVLRLFCSRWELENHSHEFSVMYAGGRQGWIKTATRVFQALRIAVNDELNTLKDSINSSFDSLSCGGRLAVISFHSLEDRIVKQAFLDIINRCDGEGQHFNNSEKLESYKEREAWIKQIVQGPNANILTKRPITPSESEERLNPRSRSAKLRVIEKIWRGCAVNLS